MKACRLAPVALLLLLAFVSGCDWLRVVVLGDSRQILRRSTSLTLAWEPPLTELSSQPTEVLGYQIYCREHDRSTYWRFLGEIPASPHPEFTVEHTQLGDGLYDFAVRATMAGGQTSDLHTSLDSSADPCSGWYVLWAQSN